MDEERVVSGGSGVVRSLGTMAAMVGIGSAPIRSDFIGASILFGGFSLRGVV